MDTHFGFSLDKLKGNLVFKKTGELLKLSLEEIQGDVETL